MVICAGCGTGREQPLSAHSGRPRTPAGWKQLQGQLWCPACKRRRFVLRAVALPVSGPSDATWPELRAALHEAFAETTRCANWLVTQLYARDRQRQPGDARLPKMRGLYLYPEARTLFPALASQTLASLEQQVQARYRAARLDLIWRHAVSLPTYRYPTPLPLPSRMWDLVVHDERWHLSVRIGHRRWSLRLRQGPGMWRQVRVLQQVAAGEVEAGEATLYEIAAQRGDHRSDGTREHRLMIKLAVWLARREAVDARDTLIVRTGPHAFVTAQVAGQDQVWTINADHVRRWIAEAARRQQRVREDLAHQGLDTHQPLDTRHAHDTQHAHDTRHTHGGRRRVAAGTELALVPGRLSAQLHRRLQAWTHQATAQLVACARRRRVAAIAWDDTDRGYVPSYPWHRFVTTLTDKASAVGISVTTQRDACDGTASASPDARTRGAAREVHEADDEHEAHDGHAGREAHEAQGPHEAHGAHGVPATHGAHERA